VEKRNENYPVPDAPLMLLVSSVMNTLLIWVGSETSELLSAAVTATRVWLAGAAFAFPPWSVAALTPHTNCIRYTYPYKRQCVYA
jgi:hypothetical protein